MKNEIVSLKKDHITPPQHVTPNTEANLPAPPSKPSPKKIIQDSNNNQMESKILAKGLHLQWRPANKPNKKRSQIHSKTMETLSTYERQFHGQLDIEMTQTGM